MDEADSSVFPERERERERKRDRDEEVVQSRTN
jgi:hypothetical protein